MKIPLRRNGEHDAAPRVSRRKVPQFPIWKDEKLFGFISLRMCLLVVGIGLSALVILFVIGFFKIVDLSNDNRNLIQDQKATSAKRHSERVADQVRTDNEIRNIACGSLAIFPKGNPVGNKLRDSYARSGIYCPPLGTAFKPIPIPRRVIAPSGAPSRSAPSQGTPTRRNSSPRQATTAPGRSTRPSPRASTITREVPAPTRTQTIVKSASPTKKPTLPVLGCATVVIVVVNCP